MPPPNSTSPDSPSSTDRTAYVVAFVGIVAVPIAVIAAGSWRLSTKLILGALPIALYVAYRAAAARTAARRQREADMQRVMQAKLSRSNRELEVARANAVAMNNAKSAFLANMSHELRTPLNAIIGYSDLILEEGDDTLEEQTRSDLEKIGSSGRQLLSLVSAILDISKVESGKMELDVHEFELDTLISDIRAVAEPLARKHRNQLVIDVQGVVETVRGDATKLRQILLNLVSNGVPDIPLAMRPADFLIDPEGLVWHAYYGKAVSDHVPFERVDEFAADDCLAVAS